MESNKATVKEEVDIRFLRLSLRPSAEDLSRLDDPTLGMFGIVHIYNRTIIDSSEGGLGAQDDIKIKEEQSSANSIDQIRNEKALKDLDENVKNDNAEDLTNSTSSDGSGKNVKYKMKNDFYENYSPLTRDLKDVPHFFLDVVSRKDVFSEDYDRNNGVEIKLTAISSESIDPLEEAAKPTTWSVMGVLNGYLSFNKQQTTENPHKPMQVKSLSCTITIPGRLLEACPYFEPFFSEDLAKLQAIHFNVPRLSSIESFITALAFNNKEVTELSETDNVYELYATAYLLKLGDLVDYCSLLMMRSLSRETIVISSYLATKMENIRLIDACYRWIMGNLVQTEEIHRLHDQYVALTMIPQTFTPRQLHFIPPNLLSFDRFLISSDLFASHFNRISKIVDEYYMPAKTEKYIETILQRNRIEGEEPIYRLFDKVSGKLLLSAIYSAEWDEYIITTSRSKEFKIFGEGYIGGVRCNLAGTLFTIFDFGSNKCDKSFGFSPFQNELAIVTYERNLLGWEPREFSLIIPKKLNNDKSVKSPQVTEMLSRQEKDNLTFFRNRSPKWNEERNTYTLDFRNKVKRASKKNFILETENEQSEKLMMGKLDIDSFHMHYASPLSLVVAMGICLSSFHKKRLVK